MGTLHVNLAQVDGVHLRELQPKGRNCAVQSVVHGTITRSCSIIQYDFKCTSDYSDSQRRKPVLKLFQAQREIDEKTSLSRNVYNVFKNSFLQ